MAKRYGPLTKSESKKRLKAKIARKPNSAKLVREFLRLFGGK